jgi:hypothetical protein
MGFVFKTQLCDDTYLVSCSSSSIFFALFMSCFLGVCVIRTLVSGVEFL